MVDGVKITVDGTGRFIEVTIDATKEIAGQAAASVLRLSSRWRAESGFSLMIVSMARSSGV